jgi:hypothetical protein
MRACFGFFSLCIVPPVFAFGCADGPDPPPLEEQEPIATQSQDLSIISCSESSATGYVQGKSFGIPVAKVDGKPVQINTANAYYVMATAVHKAGLELKILSGFRTMAEQQPLHNCLTSVFPSQSRRLSFEGANL